MPESNILLDYSQVVLQLQESGQHTVRVWLAAEELLGEDFPEDELCLEYTQFSAHTQP